MIKIVLLTMLATLSACGGSSHLPSPTGEGQGEGANGDEAHAVSPSPFWGEGRGEGSVSFPNGKMILDRRFDERGRIIGVYAVPYNPCDLKPCEKK